MQSLLKDFSHTTSSTTSSVGYRQQNYIKINDNQANLSNNSVTDDDKRAASVYVKLFHIMALTHKEIPYPEKKKNYFSNVCKLLFFLSGNFNYDNFF